MNIKKNHHKYSNKNGCLLNRLFQTLCASIKYLLSLFFVVFSISAQSAKAIIVATHIEPPFSDIIDGEFVGENIDIANALAEKLNKNVRFVYCPIARCLSLIRDGKADMIVAVRKTAIREQFLYYLNPPIKIQKQPLRFYIRANSKVTVDKYDDLQPLKIGVLRGASYFDKFDHDTKIVKIPLTTHQQLINMLLKGRIDTFLEREESITPLVEQKVYATSIKLAKYSYDKGVGSYIAISKKSPFVNELSEFSSALSTLQRTGKIKTITSNTQYIQ